MCLDHKEIMIIMLLHKKLCHSGQNYENYDKWDPWFRYIICIHTKIHYAEPEVPKNVT